MLKGVTDLRPGYAGGDKDDPSYEDVCRGDTGHAEVIHIEYDPDRISYSDLLTVFFASHDPTTLNRQGADVGTQYRSTILTTSPSQKEDAERFIKDINASSTTGASIVTEVKPLEKFYEAEQYHRDYYAKNPYQGYCQAVIQPKLEKLKKHFVDLLKEQGKENE